MSLPVIVASETSTNEPTEIVTFNKWWIQNLSISGNLSGQVTALATLAKFGTKEDGTMVFNDEKFTLYIEDVLYEASVDNDLASAVGLLISYIGKKAITEGKADNVII